MLLEFADRSQIEVKAIFGGPRIVAGVLRDVLRIEIDPATISFEELKSIFKDESKISALYTYDEVAGETEKVNVGNDYSVFISISYETEYVAINDNTQPYRTNDVFVVSIGQSTYYEKKFKESQDSSK